MLLFNGATQLVRFSNKVSKKELLLSLVSSPFRIEKGVKFPSFFNTFCQKVLHSGLKISKHNPFLFSKFSTLDRKRIESKHNPFSLASSPLWIEKGVKFPSFFGTFFQKVLHFGWKMLKYNPFFFCKFSTLDGKRIIISILFRSFFQKSSPIRMEIFNAFSTNKFSTLELKRIEILSVGSTNKKPLSSLIM